MHLEKEASRAKAAEQERVTAELKLMQTEDTPALDLEEIAELRRRAFEAEEAARITREAEEEAALAFKEDSSDEEDDDDDAGDDDQQSNNSF